NLSYISIFSYETCRPGKISQKQKIFCILFVQIQRQLDSVINQSQIQTYIGLEGRFPPEGTVSHRIHNQTFEWNTIFKRIACLPICIYQSPCPVKITYPIISGNTVT